MTVDDVRKALRKVCDKAGGQAEWARTAHVTPAYVCDVLAGRRLPGFKVLDPLGIEKARGYRWRNGRPAHG